ncbi:AmmeMemoRadiSam system protein B [Candidatus Peregrinibacteria bacterium]|nr:AmmeMemoRadiSam system protein B [Candidatus Peregrinibacteria bacterium]
MKITLREIVYLIGILLLAAMFGFGSYVKDLHTLNTDSFFTSAFKPFKHQVYGGIAPSSPDNIGEIRAYFEKINLTKEPDVFVIISETDKKSEKAAAVTQKSSYKTPYGDVFYDNVLINTLTVGDFLKEDPYLFSPGDDIAKFIPYIDQAFPDAQVVPVYLTLNADSRAAYHLAKLLATEINKTKKSVFVLALSDSAAAKVENAQVHMAGELHNFTFERSLNNFDYLERLDIENSKAVRVLFNYLLFQGIKEPYVIWGDSDLYAYYINNKNSDNEDKRMQRVTMMAFGDVMLDRSVRVLMDANGLNYPFEKISDPELKLMKGIDFVFANLEGPIHEIYTPTSKSIAFRFKPDIVEVIKQAGITIVSIANNHALDQGWGGRDDTLKFLQQGGVLFFGHPKNTVGGEGRDVNEKIMNVSGSRVAFLGFDDTIFKIESGVVGEYIKSLKERVDFVIVSVHWGAEYTHKPGQRQKDLAHMFIDSGADIVLGHHPHVVQTMEIYESKPIFYSLGNFVFDQYFSVDTQEGLGVGVVLEKDRRILYLFPYSIPHSQPTLMNDEESSRFLEKFISWGEYDEEFKDKIRAGKIMLID